MSGVLDRMAKRALGSLPSVQPLAGPQPAPIPAGLRVNLLDWESSSGPASRARLARDERPDHPPTGARTARDTDSDGSLRNYRELTGSRTERAGAERASRRASRGESDGAASETRDNDFRRIASGTGERLGGAAIQTFARHRDKRRRGRGCKASAMAGSRGCRSRRAEGSPAPGRPGLRRASSPRRTVQASGVAGTRATGRVKYGGSHFDREHRVARASHGSQARRGSVPAAGQPAGLLAP